jgi:uroporphyrinogen-III synthase
MLPLSGLRIVVTRAAHQAEELAEPLRERGAIPILLPAIGIAPPTNPEPLAHALANLPRYDWIVLTSVNAIRAVGEQPACRARIATVGAATREFAEAHGWRVSVTPETYVAESLVAALGVEDLQGCRILIPSVAIARDVVREELARRGALVDVVEAYRNVMPAELPARAATVFQPPFPDWITFASSSAVGNLLSVISVETLRHSKIASIGPVTSETIRRHSLTVAAEPVAHTVAALVEAIVQAVCASTA